MSETVDNIVENNDPAFPIVEQGYATGDVQHFVTEAQSLVARLLSENSALREELKEKDKATNSYRQVAQESTGMLVHAQQVAAEFIEQANSTADATVKEADEYRERVINEATVEGQKITDEAEARWVELEAGIETLVTRRDEIAAKVLAFHKQEVESLSAYIETTNNGE